MQKHMSVVVGVLNELTIMSIGVDILIMTLLYIGNCKRNQLTIYTNWSRNYYSQDYVWFCVFENQRHFNNGIYTTDIMRFLADYYPILSLEECKDKVTYPFIYLQIDSRIVGYVEVITHKTLKERLRII